MIILLLYYIKILYDTLYIGEGVVEEYAKVINIKRRS